MAGLAADQNSSPPSGRSCGSGSACCVATGGRWTTRRPSGTVADRSPRVEVPAPRSPRRPTWPRSAARPGQHSQKESRRVRSWRATTAAIRQPRRPAAAASRRRRRPRSGQTADPQPGHRRPSRLLLWPNRPTMNTSRRSSARRPVDRRRARTTPERRRLTASAGREHLERVPQECRPLVRDVELVVRRARVRHPAPVRHERSGVPEGAHGAPSRARRRVWRLWVMAPT